jgi:hypothetical protein
MIVRFQIALACLALLLARTAYGEGAECETRCGMKVPAFQCEEFRDAETRVLSAFSANVYGWAYGDACDALSDWRVFIHVPNKRDAKQCKKTGGFAVGPNKKCFAGFTHVFTHEMELEGLESVSDGVFAHELVHALQTAFAEDIGHCSWYPRGIVRAIRASGYPVLYAAGICAPITDLENYR